MEHHFYMGPDTSFSVQQSQEVVKFIGRQVRNFISKNGKFYLRSEAVLGSLISRETIRDQEFSLPQNPNPFFSSVRNQVPRPHNLHQIQKFTSITFIVIPQKHENQNNIDTSVTESFAGFAISFTRHSAIGALCSLRIAAAL